MRSRTSGAVLAVLALVAIGATVSAAAVSPRGHYIETVLDSMKVEEHWLAGDAVDWRTGEHDPLARPLKTHCSAFVAAVCDVFHLPILHPPEHSEWLLANAQCAWLEERGPQVGWSRVDDGIDAQRLANRGHLVVACYRNPDRDDPGHIAVIRPSGKSLRAIQREGPDIAQAGKINYSRTSARIGFSGHARAWHTGKLSYYAHRIY